MSERRHATVLAEQEREDVLPHQLQQRAGRQERLLQRILDRQIQGPRRCAVDDIVHVPACHDRIVVY